MPKTITSEQSLQRAKKYRDQVLKTADAKKRAANKELAEQVKEYMAINGKGISDVAELFEWSRPSTYELFEKAGVEIKRLPKSKQGETNDG